jgi:hypothetical protein
MNKTCANEPYHLGIEHRIQNVELMGLLGHGR